MAINFNNLPKDKPAGSGFAVVQMDSILLPSKQRP